MSPSNTHTNQPDTTLFENALSGGLRQEHQAAYAALILRFMPQMTGTIRATLARTRYYGSGARSDDVSDLLHDVCVRLWERGPKFLEAWQEDRDLTLECLFRSAAQRVALSHVRSGRRSAWAERPSSDEVLSRATTGRVEETLVARDRLRRVFRRSRDRRACAMLHALYVEGRSLDEVCAAFSVTRNAVYCATRRFRASAQELEIERRSSYRRRRVEVGGKP
jgi:DNA-directed RNA polymerase specialized sigma24 family protein